MQPILALMSAMTLASDTRVRLRYHTPHTPPEQALASQKWARTTVVVCVCTLDRNESLVRCLNSVLHQRLGDEVDMQILVVDNSPDANARDAVLSIEGGRRSITYLHEIHRGIPVARNSALQALQHLQPTWVAFIDDDEMAPQGWLARMLLMGSAHKADVVHGSVRTEECSLAEMFGTWSCTCAISSMTTSLPQSGEWRCRDTERL